MTEVLRSFNEKIGPEFAWVRMSRRNTVIGRIPRTVCDCGETLTPSEDPNQLFIRCKCGRRWRKLVREAAEENVG